MTQIPVTWLAVSAFAGLFAIAYPLSLTWLAIRRFGGGWRYLGFGALLSLVQIVALTSGGFEQLPPEQQALAARQLAEIAAQPAWYPLAGAWERLWTFRRSDEPAQATL